MIYADILEWLKSEDSMPTVLVEATVFDGSSETTLYFSNTGYITGGGDTPSNEIYHPYVADIGSVTEALSLQGEASIAYGDIQLDNYEGNLDFMFEYVWTNRRVRMYIGDVSWSRSQFRLIFDGQIDSIAAESDKSINIKIRDKLNYLNCTLSEQVTTDDKIVPVCLGEVSNITPLLIDAQTLTYKVHTGRIGNIIEVRDNGAPVDYTSDPLTGEFQLLQAPFGNITASLHGDAPVGDYVDTPSEITKNLILNYGTSVNTLTTSDLDTANFSEVALTNTQCIGLYLNSRSNLINEINRILNSIGASLSVSKDGKIRIFQLKDVTGVSDLTITPDAIIDGTLDLEEVLEVIGAYKIAYNKNYTVQRNIVAGVPESHRDEFIEDYKFCTAINQSTINLYQTTSEPVESTTLLQKYSDVVAEAQRKLSLYDHQRFIYSFEMFAEGLVLELGDEVTLVHSRYGLSNGKNGIVVGLSSDWLNRRVGVRVLI